MRRGEALPAFVRATPRANIAIAGMIAFRYLAAAVEALHGDLGNLAVDGFKALAMQAHPAPAFETLKPRIG